MEEQKVCDAIELQSSPAEINKQEAEKQYHLLTLTRSRIREDLEQRKADAYQIKRKLMWFLQHDHYIQWKTREIKNLERCLGKAEIHMPTNLVPKRTGFFSLPEKDGRTPVRPDRKRCQKRLIKKERVDSHYLQQVQEELLCSKKSGGMTSSGRQEVNDLIDSMAQRIQHGNKCRADEMRIYREMRNVKETREIYTAPDQPKHTRNWYTRERTSKRDIDSQRYIQHKINIRLDDIEDLKMDMKGRKARVTRLKADMELVRKSISCLQKELEDVNTKRIKAYQRAYELVEQKKGLVQ
ncbi:uncharacterized protein LOC111905644 isoform X1 [Lactuca sativa]|uniref:Uncharacterized protein n=1 Tax=Lactuca sativa TaxID=4236 RepID=A0A9R1UP65_LACSA|nr:uncharacterized protein LOC111905644 isoform X1 [Lactuca sativa]KAJ0190410.1 hypothetical protein LSAT_V11C800442680 [Lactuca sativa]